jgi:hypothetical protein
LSSSLPHGIRFCTHVTILIACALALASAAAQPEAEDPVVACRAAHGGDPAAHIACLEQALRGRDTRTADTKPAPAKPAGLGAEQVRAADEPSAEEPTLVRIVSTTYDSQGHGIFSMANGEVWRETEASPSSKRLDANREYAARIERGWPSGYRMYVEGVRGMIKLRRIK